MTSAWPLAPCHCLSCPTSRSCLVLLLPAISLAFVGLVQGASISASFPNPDGRYPDTSRDFAGQGVANVAASVFQGMPVGGSLSATAIIKHAGAASRLALLLTSLVMAVVIVVFGDVVGSLAMPSLAGLLIVVGFRTVNPADLWSVWRTGPIQKVVVATTFALTPGDPHAVRGARRGRPVASSSTSSASPTR